MPIEKMTVYHGTTADVANGNSDIFGWVRIGNPQTGNLVDDISTANQFALQRAATLPHFARILEITMPKEELVIVASKWDFPGNVYATTDRVPYKELPKSYNPTVKEEDAIFYEKEDTLYFYRVKRKYIRIMPQRWIYKV